MATGLRHIALGALLALSACQQSGTATLPLAEPTAINGVGYLLFNAPVNRASRDLFITDIDKLRTVGATTRTSWIITNVPCGQRCRHERT